MANGRAEHVADGAHGAGATRILADVLPIGTPWGGPESRRFLSAFVSLQMCLVRVGADDTEALQARHERLYRLYLTVTGIGVCTYATDDLIPIDAELLVERDLPDYVARAMAYAGYRYREVHTPPGSADRGAVALQVVASIDAGYPVLASSHTGEWCLITGYERAGERWLGWDGAATYWGPLAWPASDYRENGLFAREDGPEAFARLIFVEGSCEPRRETRRVRDHLVAVMETQRAQGRNARLAPLLRDPDGWSSLPAERLRTLWHYLNDLFGWNAENRCFVGCAFGEELPALPDVAGDPVLVAACRRVAGLWSETHDLSWDGWKALRVRNACGRGDDERCCRAGNCLRAPEPEDFEGLRDGMRRTRLADLVQAIDENDGRAVEQLKDEG